MNPSVDSQKVISQLVKINGDITLEKAIMLVRLEDLEREVHILKLENAQLKSQIPPTPEQQALLEHDLV